MEHGPLPPHERTWRHPSELAAEEHALARSETAPTSTRFFAITTGTLGLLTVGLLVLVVTPRSSDAPVAISVTTTPSPTASASGAADAGRSTEPRVFGLRSPAEPLATPIGDGSFAIVTAAGVSLEPGSTLDVRLPSGALRSALVSVREGEAVLVELSESEPGLELADQRPDGDEIVTVLAEPPVTIVLDDLAELEVEEGTAVLDDDGRLIGLCSDDHPTDGVRLVDVSEAFAGATTGG